MKKIVGILAAAAIATSVFAADVSAATKIKGNLFSYTNEDKDDKGVVTPTTTALFSEGNDSHDYAQPNMTFSVSDDKAGATVKLSTDGGDKAVKLTTQTIWFKPVDAFKVTVGNFDVALNKETIKYTNSVTGLGGNGFLFTVDVSGFTLDLGLSAANEGFWFSKADGVDDPAIKSFFIKAGYAADFGTIGGYVEFNRSTRLPVYECHDAYFGLGTPKDGAISDIHFGAGYANNFDGINVFVNVAGFMADKFEWVRPEAFVSGNLDAFGFSAFVAPLIIVDSDTKIEGDKSIGCEVIAKVTYALDGITPYAQFLDHNVLAEKFTSTIEIGASGSVGVMGWKAWAEIKTGCGTSKDKVNFAVPFELTLSF